MWWLALLLAVWTLPAWAAPARVLSGEHDGFTRLVVELDSDADWTVGRTVDGYALQIAGAVNQFDLSGAFDLIGRSRIAALSVDPETGVLKMAVGCNCHVSPFEFRPGTIVLDIKDGPPPKDSPHEEILALDPQASDPMPKPGAAAFGEENALAFAWIDAALGKVPMPIVDPEPGSLGLPDLELAPEPTSMAGPDPVAASDLPVSPLMDPGLTPLRETLMQEISRGAAQGVVTMGLAQTAMPGDHAAAEPQQARVGLGALDDLPQVRVEGTAPEDLSPEGAQCPTDVQLDAAAWGDDRPIWEQMSEARNGLVGEFDRPNPEAVAKAVKFHIFIGFGQEAVAIAQSMQLTDRDQALWLSMARILDEVADPDPAFAAMQGCDSAAALWAVLAAQDPNLDGLNLAALQRSFSALPSGLRQALGPRLIERLMLLGEVDAVNVVSNAIRRAGVDQDRGVALASAEVAAQAGEYEAADKLLQPLLTDPGPQTAEALVAKIEGQAARALPMTALDLQEISAYAMERADGPQAAEFDRALVLAMALTGDFSGAFALAPDDPVLQADLWRLLSALGNDESVLAVATLMPDTIAPVEARPQAAVFAERFLRLGLPDQAQIWANGAESIDGLLSAEIALANRDGLLALSHLQGLDSEAARSMQIAAKILTGDDHAAAADLAQAGDAQGAALALARARDWAALGQDGPAEWQDAALSLGGSKSETPAGPLAEGNALADQAQETSAALRALLAAVPAIEKEAP